MIQDIPAKRATGSRKAAGVRIKLRLDSSASAASTSPDDMIQPGNNRMNQLMTDIPAYQQPEWHDERQLLLSRTQAGAEHESLPVAM